jgi:biopolymer transport protein ExbD
MALEPELTILVTVDAERKVFFRKEQVGTSDDVGPLKERVRQAIERNRQAARDEGDEEAAKSAGTVFICAAPDLKYRDVSKVVDAIKEAGGSPIGLSTDSGCNPSR